MHEKEFWGLIDHKSDDKYHPMMPLCYVILRFALRWSLIGLEFLLRFPGKSIESHVTVSSIKTRSLGNNARSVSFKSFIRVQLPFIIVMLEIWMSECVGVEVPSDESFFEPADSGFPGIYIPSLQGRCWSSDGTKVILSTAWRSSKVR